MIDITQAWDEDAIYETIVSTENEDGSTRVAPLGARRKGSQIILAPFAPSRTLDNIRRSSQAVINLCEDVTIFAGCITGRYDWPTEPGKIVRPQRLKAANTHIEVQATAEQGDQQRTKFTCDIVHSQTHKAFGGHNRARAAVIEAAVHISRIGIMATGEIQQHLTALQAQIDKTAGAKEKQAWQWLTQYFKDKTQ
ncbi:MAG: DUF447 domain-containing protein [Candidatus Porifericomitaceae bacterium WSBS_2022_MAG_OTU9]